MNRPTYSRCLIVLDLKIRLPVLNKTENREGSQRAVQLFHRHQETVPSELHTRSGLNWLKLVLTRLVPYRHIRGIFFIYINAHVLQYVGTNIRLMDLYT